MIICGDQLFYLDNLLSFILCIINLYTSNICDCDFTEFLSNGAIIPSNQSLLQINETLLKIIGFLFIVFQFLDVLVVYAVKILKIYHVKTVRRVFALNN